MKKLTFGLHGFSLSSSLTNSTLTSTYSLGRKGRASHRPTMRPRRSQTPPPEPPRYPRIPIRAATPGPSSAHRRDLSRRQSTDRLEDSESRLRSPDLPVESASSGLGWGVGSGSLNFGREGGELDEYLKRSARLHESGGDSALSRVDRRDIRSVGSLSLPRRGRLNNGEDNNPETIDQHVNFGRSGIPLPLPRFNTRGQGAPLDFGWRRTPIPTAGVNQSVLPPFGTGVESAQERNRFPSSDVRDEPQQQPSHRFVPIARHGEASPLREISRRPPEQLAGGRGYWETVLNRDHERNSIGHRLRSSTGTGRRGIAFGDSAAIGYHSYSSLNVDI